MVHGKARNSNTFDHTWNKEYEKHKVTALIPTYASAKCKCKKVGLYGERLLLKKRIFPHSHLKL